VHHSSYFIFIDCDEGYANSASHAPATTIAGTTDVAQETYSFPYASPVYSPNIAQQTQAKRTIDNDRSPQPAISVCGPPFGKIA
jgi:hypothetical protein